jgi:hypothetical protein
MSGVLSYSFKPPDTLGGRGAAGSGRGGQFTGGWAKAKRSDEVLNRVRDGFTRLAVAVQDDVGQRYLDERIREGGTGRLARVTRNPRNRSITQTSMAVGIPSYLDASVAKYWRTIDQGSAVTMPSNWLGRRIYGSFKQGGSWSPPRSSMVGVGRGEFFPGKRTVDGSYSAGKLKRGGAMGYGSGRGTIQTHIEAKNAYRTVWRTLEVSDQARRIVDAAIFGG